MNTKSVILCTVCATALSCFGQSNVVYYGANSNALDVVFADTNLSQKAKSAIVADLRICLLGWGKQTELRLGADAPAFVAHLSNPDTCPHYPNGVDFPDDIVDTSNGFALQIPKDLSDVYTNAFAFAVANAKAVAAANAFVKFVSSTNFNNMTSGQLSNYVLFNKAPAILYELDFVNTTNSLRMQTYYLPSVLGFYQSKEGPAAKNLWMLIPSSRPSDDSLFWHPFPAIWHDGKWKFCLWQENPKYTLPDDD